MRFRQDDVPRGIDVVTPVMIGKDSRYSKTHSDRSDDEEDFGQVSCCFPDSYVRLHSLVVKC